MALRDPERERSLWRHQWCELHQDVCESVDVLRRKNGLSSVPLLVCPKCLRDLKSTGYLRPSRWAGQDCWEITGAEEKPGRAPYIVELNELDVILLRALGYTVQEVDSGDQRSDC